MHGKVHLDASLPLNLLGLVPNKLKKKGIIGRNRTFSLILLIISAESIYV
jgi:hypothetical protein